MWGRLGGVEEGETIIRVYCMREESIFNKRKNITTKSMMSDTFKRWRGLCLESAGRVAGAVFLALQN